MKLFYLDLGHNPRSASTALDERRRQAAGGAERLVRATTSKAKAPNRPKPHGGVTAITSFCPQTAGGSGTEYKAANWASLAPGEIALTSAAEQTIVAPGTAPGQRVHVGHRLHDAVRGRQRLGGHVQARRPRRRAASRSSAPRR